MKSASAEADKPRSPERPEAALAAACRRGTGRPMDGRRTKAAEAGDGQTLLASVDAGSFEG